MIIVCAVSDIRPSLVALMPVADKMFAASTTLIADSVGGLSMFQSYPYLPRFCPAASGRYGESGPPHRICGGLIFEYHQKRFQIPVPEGGFQESQDIHCKT